VALGYFLSLSLPNFVLCFLNPLEAISGTLNYLYTLLRKVTNVLEYNDARSFRKYNDLIQEIFGSSLPSYCVLDNVEDIFPLR
jgi:hypothetical protein